jgi:hypothetical protein
VDSRVYAAPFRLQTGRSVGVPIPDGTTITIDWNRAGGQKVLVADQMAFRTCDDRIATISDASTATSFFAESQVSETSRFVGGSVGLCRTVDEGWFFIFKGATGYIGYAGPSPVPLAVVGMQCR